EDVIGLCFQVIRRDYRGISRLHPECGHVTRSVVPDDCPECFPGRLLVSCNCFRIRVVDMEGPEVRGCCADSREQCLDLLRHRCGIFPRAGPVREDVRLPPDPEVPGPVGLECRDLLCYCRSPPVFRQAVERLRAERAAARCTVGTAPGGLQFAHHVRVVRVLPDDPAARHAPRVGPSVIQLPGRSVAGEIIVECNRRFPGKQSIKPADYLTDRLLPTFPGIAKADGAANQFLRTPDHVPDLLDLGERGRGTAKVLSRHGYPRDHHEQGRRVHFCCLKRVFAELVDREIPYLMAVGDQGTCYRADVGRDVRRDPEARGLINVPVEEESGRPHMVNPIIARSLRAIWSLPRFNGSTSLSSRSKPASVMHEAPSSSAANTARSPSVNPPKLWTWGRGVACVVATTGPVNRGTQYFRSGMLSPWAWITTIVPSRFSSRNRSVTP